MCVYETHVTYPQKFFMICVQTPSCITVYTKKENISFFLFGSSLQSIVIENYK